MAVSFRQPIGNRKNKLFSDRHLIRQACLKHPIPFKNKEKQ